MVSAVLQNKIAPGACAAKQKIAIVDRDAVVCLLYQLER
jgi:hypothetical protein